MRPVLRSVPFLTAFGVAIQAVSDSFAASIMAPDAPAVRGRAAIKAFAESFPRVKTFTLTNDTIVGGGDLAHVRGNFAITFADSTMGGLGGKFIEIRRRQTDGSWPLEIDLWNTNAPPPGPAPTPTRRWARETHA